MRFAIGGEGGSGGDGGTVKVTNSGVIQTSSRGACGIYAQSIGGGGGNASVMGGPWEGIKWLQYFGFGVNIGATGGDGGNGGAVSVTSTGDIITQGNNANGIFAQSVGGRGGSGSVITQQPFLWNGSFLSGASGNGGAVAVSQTGNITTYGDDSHGIVAQSIAGNDNGGKVNVTLNDPNYPTATPGNIITNGMGSCGIVAQSLGVAGNGNIDITINQPTANSGMVQGGYSGTVTNSDGSATNCNDYGVLIMDGQNNTLINHGSISTLDGATGTAVMVQASYGSPSWGDLTIDNYGTISGSVNQGTQAASALNQGLSLPTGQSTITFNNNQGSTYNAGPVINLGGGTLSNSGLLTLGTVQSALTGNYTQTGTGTFQTTVNGDGSGPGRKEPSPGVYFGETHVHTSWSFDAYIFGNTLTGPAEAYEYALGKPIKHPTGYTIQLTRPLDWMGVTDHSEYVGTVRLANEPGSPISKLPIAEKLKVRSQADIQRIFLWLGGTMANNQPVKELVDPQVAGTIWKENVAIADRYKQPGKFTTFAAYEWTSTPDNCNLHRNIFFKDSKKVPDTPFSSLDSQHPEDLWQWMDGQRQKGHELLAISHNANLSDGLMFPTEVDSRGRPLDAAWAAARMRNEMLSEIKQIKGQSETHPLLSPNDEFANFEVLNYLLMVTQNRPIQISGSYLREALKNGMAMQDSRGYNPFKVGFVGGSDSHDTGVPYRQKNFFGAHGVNDGGLKARLSGLNFSGLDILQENPAGLTGVWAEENTREAIFEAMQRRETYGTSGPRHKLRLGNTPYEAMVYRLGDKYYGARSNEFGFANYELLAVSPGAPAAGVSEK